MKISPAFYQKSALQLAQDLLGATIVRKYRGKLIMGKITETEAYIGPHDKGSHTFQAAKMPRARYQKLLQPFLRRIPRAQQAAFLKNVLKRQGKMTPRTFPMFLRGGHAYVYLIYGMYFNFNISANHAGFPEGVLIRAVEPIQNPFASQKNRIIPHGPGKVCQFFKINTALSGIDLSKSTKLWLESKPPRQRQIQRTPRIGIDYAEEYKNKKWRFILRSEQ